MEFSEVIQRQRMTRRFEQRPIERTLLDSILSCAQKAPSAGYAQGVSLAVLENRRTDLFWRFVDPIGRHAAETRPPVVVIQAMTSKPISIAMPSRTRRQAVSS